MKTALVIDDSRQPADMLCQLLRLFDIQSSPAYGARAALLYLKENVPDLIFLDLGMPGVDGFEILAYLRREPRFLHTPVIVVTADDAPETACRARQEGALDVVIKPATIDALEAVLRAAKMVE
jgi:DNA-binding response OmpR family regulator